MFPNKERQWITGPFDNKIMYDNWRQWADLFIYKYWIYKPLLWNIQDLDNGSYNLQILYTVSNGHLKVVSISINVNKEDEAEIDTWLKAQPWLSN